MINKKCNGIFKTHKMNFISYKYGYAPLEVIKKYPNYYEKYAKGIMWYRRRDILNWLYEDKFKWRLAGVCREAIIHTRLDVLEEIFTRPNNDETLDYLRRNLLLCYDAARLGNLQYLKFFRQNGCMWNNLTWKKAKENNHEHILQYLRENGYPSEWQNECETSDD